jgi:hypothetical protein
LKHFVLAEDYLKEGLSTRCQEDVEEPGKGDLQR